MRILWPAVLVVAAMCPVAGAAGTDDEKAILATIQKVFDGMAGHDMGMIRGAMTEDARLTVLRGERPVTTVPLDQFLKGLEGNQSRLLERIWSPTILVRGRLASVWAEYDFHADGKFGHCGVDSFSMAKTADGWKITSIAYTSETEGCAPSPLGPAK